MAFDIKSDSIPSHSLKLKIYVYDIHEFYSIKDKINERQKEINELQKEKIAKIEQQLKKKVSEEEKYVLDFF